MKFSQCLFLLSVCLCTFTTVFADTITGDAFQRLKDSIGTLEGDLFIPKMKECTPNLMQLYEGCSGDIEKCASCVSAAEGQCRKIDQSGACSTCTSQTASRCKSGTKMCYSDQECNIKNYECINYQCVYVQPS